MASGVAKRPSLLNPGKYGARPERLRLLQRTLRGKFMTVPFIIWTFALTGSHPPNTAFVTFEPIPTVRMMLLRSFSIKNVEDAIFPRKASHP